VTRNGASAGIQERAFTLALRVLHVVRALGRDTCARGVARQIARSGTSVGANVEEAQGARSRVDFARCMNIARAEAIETRYWLRLLAESGMLKKTRLTPLIQECDELVRILSTIVKKARVVKQPV
jgi:four helix bundle protein